MSVCIKYNMSYCDDNETEAGMGAEETSQGKVTIMKGPF